MEKSLSLGLLLVVVVLSIAGFVACNIRPTYAQTQFDRIGEYYQKRDWDKVIETAPEYLKANPKDDTTILRLAESYIEKKSLSLAELYAKKALQVKPSSSWAVRVLARIYWEQSKAVKSSSEKSRLLNLARLEIEKVLAVTPNETWANMDAALIYIDFGDKEKAKKCIAISIKNEPSIQSLKNIQKKTMAMPG